MAVKIAFLASGAAAKYFWQGAHRLIAQLPSQPAVQLYACSSAEPCCPRRSLRCTVCTPRSVFPWLVHCCPRARSLKHIAPCTCPNLPDTRIDPRAPPTATTQQQAPPTHSFTQQKQHPYTYGRVRLLLCRILLPGPCWPRSPELCYGEGRLHSAPCLCHSDRPALGGTRDVPPANQHRTVAEGLLTRKTRDPTTAHTAIARVASTRTLNRCPRPGPPCPWTETQ